MSSFQTDVVVVGGGQSGLATGYFLRRTGLSFVILDAEEKSGGAWGHGWDSLHLFSPAEQSSLPGWLMPRSANEYPTRDEVMAYLAQYESRYRLPVRRPVRVENSRWEQDRYHLETSGGQWQARAVVSATGTWQKPYIPPYPGREQFGGRQVHSARYRRPEDFAGQKVLIVGGGNSGAQILAEVSRQARVTWVTEREPVFLPDEVDGRYLFGVATRQYEAQQQGRTIQQPGSLGDVVMVSPVKEARSRGVLRSVRPFTAFTPEGVTWPDGREEPFDAVIWCTGFRPALDFLAGLGVLEPDGRVRTDGTRAVKSPRLWLVGYGSWTGFASATLIGVGRSARSTASEIAAGLSG